MKSKALLAVLAALALVVSVGCLYDDEESEEFYAEEDDHILVQPTGDEEFNEGDIYTNEFFSFYEEAGEGILWEYDDFVFPESSKGCYRATGFSVKDWHFIYWFTYRPSSYDAYLWSRKVRADPYGKNGVLVQKRDICLYCGCNPAIALYAIQICAK